MGYRFTSRRDPPARCGADEMTYRGGGKPRFNPVIGSRFGRLVVLDTSLRTEPTYANSLGHRRFKCACDCGAEVVVNPGSLSRLEVQSCGCLALEAIRKVSESNVRHGLWRHPLYGTWLSIRARCYHKNHVAYRWYGGRGISMYEEWISSPRQFISWIEANLGPRPPKYSLDRIDNDGNYTPGNLRWADTRTQAMNKRHRAGLVSK